MYAERIKSYIEWLENGGGFDREECLSYLRDALSDAEAIEDLTGRRDYIRDHMNMLEEKLARLQENPPVVRGEWVIENSVPCCSACGQEPKMCCTELVSWRTNYCPNCGADMRPAAQKGGGEA